MAEKKAQLKADAFKQAQDAVFSGKIQDRLNAMKAKGAHLRQVDFHEKLRTLLDVLENPEE